MSIMMASANQQGGPAVKAARHRMLLRGAMIFAIGALLDLFSSPIAVVLGSIAMIFFFLNPLTRWRTRWLWVALLVFGVGGAAVQGALQAMTVYDQWFSGVYPVLAWFSYGVAGMLVHRCLASKTWKIALAVLVPAAALAAWGAYLRNSENEDLAGGLAGDLNMPEYGEGWSGFMSNFTAYTAHSGGLADVGFSVAMALAVICLCMVICAVKPLAILLYPLRAMGAMSLTAYTAHVISAHWLVGSPMDNFDDSKFNKMSKASDPKDNLDWMKDIDFSQFDPNEWSNVWITLITIIIFSAVWKLFFRRGPIEQIISFLERKGLRDDLPGMQPLAGAPRPERVG